MQDLFKRRQNFHRTFPLELWRGHQVLAREVLPNLPRMAHSARELQAARCPSCITRYTGAIVSVGVCSWRLEHPLISQGVREAVSDLLCTHA